MGATTSSSITFDGSRLCKTDTRGGDSVSMTCIPASEITSIEYTNEQWKDYESIGHIDVDYCIDGELNGVEECMGIFSRSNPNGPISKFSFQRGVTPCKTYFYRPGMVLTQQSSDPNFQVAKDTFGDIRDGTLCRLQYRDYNYNDDDLTKCCLGLRNPELCNKNTINNFTTSHCNPVMLKHCVKGNVNTGGCMLWLENSDERGDNVALEHYSSFCSDSHHDKVCDYLCKIARQHEDYRSEFCDVALKKYCENNPTYSECGCVFTPESSVSRVEEFLGPKECWLSECASQPNSKWLTTAQRDTRQKCNITSCIISIKELTLSGNGSVDLVNSCLSGTTTNSASLVSNQKKALVKFIEDTPGVMLSFQVGILGLSLFLLMSV